MSTKRVTTPFSNIRPSELKPICNPAINKKKQLFLSN